MWETLWPLLAAAAGTLAVTTFVQLWVVPRVESRKRREDRWERDVLALGEFLEFDLAQARDELVSALFLRGLLTRAPEGGEQERKMREDNQSEVRDALEAFRRATSRARWLLDRCTYLERHAMQATRATVGLLRTGVETDPHVSTDDGVGILTARDAVELTDRLKACAEPAKEYVNEALHRPAPQPETRLKRSMRNRPKYLRFPSRGTD